MPSTANSSEDTKLKNKLHLYFKKKKEEEEEGEEEEEEGEEEKNVIKWYSDRVCSRLWRNDCSNIFILMAEPHIFNFPFCVNNAPESPDRFAR